MEMSDWVREVEEIKAMHIVPGSVVFVRIKPDVYSAEELHLCRFELEKLFPMSVVMIGENIQIDSMSRAIWDFCEAALEAMGSGRARPASKPA